MDAAMTDNDERHAANGADLPPKDSNDVPDNANENCPGASSDNAGKASACAGCPNQSICASGGGQQKPDPDLAVIKERLAGVKHKLLVLSGKGGVGKSTVSSQLALGLAEMGYQVGLLDIDLCGPSIPRMLGLQGSDIHSSAVGWEPVYVSDNLGVMSIGFMLPEEDEAVIWRGPRKNGLIKQFLRDVNWGELDFLIVDTPPGTSDEHLSIVQFLQMEPDSDGCVLVTTPQEVAMADVRKEANFCRKVNLRMIGVIENMAQVVLPVTQLEFKAGGSDATQSVWAALRNAGIDPEALSITASILDKRQGGAESFHQRTGVQVLGSIPMDPTLGRASEDGQFVPEECAAGSAIEEILRRIEKAFH